MLLCSSVGALLDGRSVLHMQPDGSLKSPAPQEEAVKDEVVRLAIEVLNCYSKLCCQLIVDLCLHGQPICATLWLICRTLDKPCGSSR